MAKPLLTKLLRGPYTQEVLKELALHIQHGEGPALFANVFLELLRDPTNDAGRRDATAFLLYVGTRTWKEVLQEISKVIDQKTLKIFKTEKADVFYQGWRYMVKAQVNDYWMKFIESEKKKGRKAV